ncbi:HAMP domain-containing histidine kinase [bacterium]|nr:HAMP domain-containing histidine kinase [bacterium]
MFGTSWWLAGALGAGAAWLATSLAHRRRARALEAAISDRLHANDARVARFLSMISHELRTPLSSVLAFAEFLEDGLGGPLTKDQGAYVNRIQVATAQMQRLVDDLLDYHRVSQGRFQLACRPLNYCELVKGVVAQARPAFKTKEQRLELILPHHLAPVYGDPERLAQVLLNLLSNASRYTPHGASVRVEVAREGVEIATRVIDNGPGISAEAQAQLFEPFFQAQGGATSRQSGLGLGLAIAQGLMLAHHGELSVESAPGKGTVFTARMPLAAAGFTLPLERAALTQPLELPPSMQLSEA